MNLNVLLLLGAYMFCAGLILSITRKNAIMILIGIELMLNASNLNFIVFSQQADNVLDGQLFSLFVIVLAAAEAAVGLAIIVQMYRKFRTTELDRVNSIQKG
ncbi:NADH-quinone oxidoreductase subunit NuoK [Fulvivirga sedimenti]|uniref:NADH-quinone oxidoreductase subunit K n=1 Tax=Fulvivirga sedimenti TaxID=2879465 RepID=A0A9X1HUA9_9BACT|nr:NADH-quinone oxidoreductase subunit NuoK [Fulvivirga sedimenti]MCA6075397.1 NADH-quinone oxidoreductase subunit NuoK [Fulvivirga sedimenti]MCA6076574.1 NADH-quinone oxidoreductase subunit NuoK [Fulvivirga sedimenti]MCA6077702.1 NADH-quinone oxidoreductase subunit NuoK [Fulvivirga sedimenti]